MPLWYPVDSDFRHWVGNYTNIPTPGSWGNELFYLPYGYGQVIKRNGKLITSTEKVQGRRCYVELFKYVNYTVLGFGGDCIKPRLSK